MGIPITTLLGSDDAEIRVEIATPEQEYQVDVAINDSGILSFRLGEAEAKQLSEVCARALQGDVDKNYWECTPLDGGYVVIVWTAFSGLSIRPV